MAFREHRTKCGHPGWWACILLVWVALFPLAANAQRRGNSKPTKAPVVSIDINRATPKEFGKLPGVGPELARRIVAYRSKHGPFRRVEDLLAIRGIGPKKWKTLRPYLRIEEKSKGRATDD